MSSSRLIVDRRGGADRRDTPRRVVVGRARRERRCVVDRRHGAERRSTLDRRGRPRRVAGLPTESPSEHVRNSLQLLAHVEPTDEHDVRATLAALMERLHRALSMLERR